MDLDSAIRLLVVTATCVAAVTDFRKRKIPNWLTGPLCVAGLVYHAVVGGAEAGAASLIGIAVGLALLIGPYLGGVLGAGDVKIVAALGGCLGPVDATVAVLYSWLALGLWSAAVVICDRTGGKVRSSPPSAENHQRAEPSMPPRAVPYAAAVAIGTLLLAILH